MIEKIIMNFVNSFPCNCFSVWSFDEVQSSKIVQDYEDEELYVLKRNSTKFIEAKEVVIDDDVIAVVYYIPPYKNEYGQEVGLNHVIVYLPSTLIKRMRPLLEAKIEDVGMGGI